MANAGEVTGSNLIVNYLPQTFTERELYSMFSTIGLVESCKVIKDFKTGYSFGFGFVNYSRPEDAEKAIKELNGIDILSKKIKVSYARPPSDDIKDTNLYVSNLPRHFKEVDLEMLFCKYGTIVQKNLLVDKITGLPRGVAFVRFNKREEALEAIKNLDGQILEGGRDPLAVKVAVEHGKQKAAYYAGWQAGFRQSRGRGNNSQGTGRGGLLNIHGSPQSGLLNIHGSPQGGLPNIHGSPRGGLPNIHGSPRGGLGDTNVNSFNSNQLVSYPIRNNFGPRPIRQVRMQQRYNPMGFGIPNNKFSPF